ncbi:10949_t:CDS:1, partial [Racocetra fulgida]
KNKWAYEIIDNKGEMVLLKFKKVSDNYIIRKMMPPTFDNYMLILDPIKYFDRPLKHKYFMVNKKKYYDSVNFVASFKKKDEKITEDLYNYVKARLSTIIIGSTVLQE